MSGNVDSSSLSRQESVHALHAFQDELLPETIANALRTSFFREHWVGCDLNSIDHSNLSKLPTVEKEHIRAAGDGARVRAGVICDDVFTTGTTGNPLITVRSDREQKFIRDFFRRQLRERPITRLLRGLEFKNPYHGHLVGIPALIHNHSVSVYDAGGFDYARSTLLGRHNDANVEERCSILLGLERCLRAFTLDTIGKFPDGFTGSELRVVVSYSQYLTSAWRRRLQETWRAPVVDRFGISEVFGGASQCLHCGWYHFEPFVVPEVIGAHSGQIISSGAGLLALTALYPFQQAQPLVRYLTGDLVETTNELSCRPGTTAIKPLGRARYGVPEPGSDRWLVTPASVLEAVDEISEIQRTPRFAGVSQIRDPYAIGHPKYRTRWSKDGHCLRVKVEFVPASGLSDARQTEIRPEILSRVVKANSTFERALRDRTASIEVYTCDDIEEGDLIAQAHSGGVWSDA
jgi:hypothetical protein